MQVNIFAFACNEGKELESSGVILNIRQVLILKGGR